MPGLDQHQAAYEHYLQAHNSISKHGLRTIDRRRTFFIERRTGGTPAL
jgi:hypothetical protein